MRLVKYLFILSLFFSLPLFAMDASLIDEGLSTKKQKLKEVQNHNFEFPTLLTLSTHHVAQEYGKMSLQAFLQNQPNLPEELKALISLKMIEQKPKIAETILQQIKIPYVKCCGHAKTIVSVAYHPGGNLLITGSDDGTVKIWNTKTGKCLRFFDEFPREVKSVAFSPDGTQIAAGMSDGAIRIWDTEIGECLHEFNHIDRVELIVFSSDGKHIGGAYDGVKIWNIETENCVHMLDGRPDKIYAIAYSPDGNYFVTGSDIGTVTIWDTQTGTCLHTLNDHTDRIYEIAFSPDSTFFATASKDSMVKIWDPKTGDCKHNFDHENEVSAVTFHPNGRSIATGSDNTIATILGTQAGNLLQEFDHNDCVNSVYFSPNGLYIITGSSEGVAKICDVQTGKCLKILKHDSEVFFAFFNPNASQVVTINGSDEDEDSNDNTIKLWDLKTFNKVYSFLTKSNYILENYLTIEKVLLLRDWANAKQKEKPFDLKNSQIKDVFDSLQKDIKKIIQLEKTE